MEHEKMEIGRDIRKGNKMKTEGLILYKLLAILKIWDIPLTSSLEMIHKSLIFRILVLSQYFLLESQVSTKTDYHSTLQRSNNLFHKVHSASSNHILIISMWDDNNTNKTTLKYTESKQGIGMKKTSEILISCYSEE